MDQFEYNGVILEYEVSGTGIPFVFLHGMGGSVEQIRSVYEPVRGIRLISMNQQGHGNSGVNWDRFDFDHLGDDVIALLDHMGVEKAVLGGISMGAAVSLNTAVRYPERVQQLLLIRNAWTDHPMPVTIIACRNDLCHPYEYGSYLAGQIADASFIEIPDKDTDGMEHKRMINEAILRMF